MNKYILTVRMPIYKKNGNFSHFGISKHMSEHKDLTDRQREELGWRVLEIREMNHEVGFVNVNSINFINLN